MATGLEKVSFHSNPKERQCQRMFKLPHNCTHLTYWQVKVKVAQSGLTLCNPMDYTVHGILQARLQQYVNRELPAVQAGFRKGRGIADQIANVH